MAQTTRTLNPLPFEALEPRRFEDLVRQLAYDFRNWQSLEATGRTGSDDGFDARGWEARPASGIVEREEDDEESQEPPMVLDSPRKWLIQCKRERRIGPTKIVQYVDDIDPEEAKSLYGIVLAVACDLSKKSRDAFRERCRDLGIAEIHVWSKGEIEDMLFQPKNDSLLFAYFNISLRIRQRTMKTTIRSRIAMKRKVKRLLGGPFNRRVLIRDPEEERYPFIEPGTPRHDYNWRMGSYTEDDYDGIRIHVRTFHAYFDPDGIHWDTANAYDERNDIERDPWFNEEEWPDLRKEIMEFIGSNLTSETAGKIEVTAILPYDKIVEIDEVGDELCSCPHIYFPFKNKRIDCDLIIELLVPARLKDPDDLEAGVIEARRLYNPNLEHRIDIFPAKFKLPI